MKLTQGSTFSWMTSPQRARQRNELNASRFPGDVSTNEQDRETRPVKHVSRMTTLQVSKTEKRVQWNTLSKRFTHGLKPFTPAACMFSCSVQQPFFFFLSDLLSLLCSSWGDPVRLTGRLNLITNYLTNPAVSQEGPKIDLVFVPDFFLCRSDKQ